jgi:hypothetical protein
MDKSMTVVRVFEITTFQSCQKIMMPIGAVVLNTTSKGDYVDVVIECNPFIEDMEYEFTFHLSDDNFYYDGLKKYIGTFGNNHLFYRPIYKD